MLEDEQPHYDVELTDADIVEECETLDIAIRDDVRPSDHEVAINTAQELVRQRGILMQDLESALNLCRRYAGVLQDNHFPDPNQAILRPLLQKYGMDGPREWPSGKVWSIGEKSIPAKPVNRLPECTCPATAVRHYEDCPRGKVLEAKALAYATGSVTLDGEHGD